MPSISDLTVEDGTGLAAANSYISIADADTYHDLRGNTAWAAASESDKVIALVRATSYVDTRWTFTGEPVQKTQALSFPKESEYLNRQGADVSESVPAEIEFATAEYALSVLGDGTALVDLSPAVDQTEPRSISYKREKVGDLEEETRFDTARGVKVTLSYPTADRLIKSSGFLAGGRSGGTIR